MEQWKTLYPNSLVLKKRGEFRSPYESYNRSPGKLGIFGRRNLDTRLPGKARVLGIRTDTAAMVFPLDEVRKARIVHTQVGSLPVVLVAAEENLPVVAYDRRVNDEVRTFTLAETRSAALRVSASLSVRTSSVTLSPSPVSVYNWIATGKVERVRTAGGSTRIFVDTLWRTPDDTAVSRSDSRGAGAAAPKRPRTSSATGTAHRS